MRRTWSGLVVALLGVLACGDDGSSPSDAGRDAAMDGSHTDGGSTDAGDTCGDGRQSGDESDTDCGGSCAACALDQRCSEDSDCASDACGAAGRCIRAECGDGVRNGTESGIDCGGSCDACPIGRPCNARSDCASRLCQEGLCRDESCDNGARDEGETDVDCGGACGTCGPGEACVVANDCRSAACESGFCLDGCQVSFGPSCAEVDVTYFKGSAAGPADEFGRGVAVDGDRLVMGAPQRRTAESGRNAGEVHVFARIDGAWTLEAVIVADVPRGSAHFGDAVDLAGDLLVVGAPAHSGLETGVDPLDEPGATAERVGAAYVFERGPAGWTQVAFIKPPNSHEDQRFGEAVTTDGTQVLVGASLDSASSPEALDVLDAPDAGGVFVYSRRAGTWTHDATIKPPTLDAGDRFGQSLTIVGDLLLVGAPDEDGVEGDPASDGLSGSGAVFVYRFMGGEWRAEAYLKAPNGGPGDAFGAALAFDGEWLVVSATEEDGSAAGVDPPDDNMAMDSGAAYVFHRGGGGAWTFVTMLKASNPSSDDEFGQSVAVLPGGVAVGSGYEDGPGQLFDGIEGDGPTDDAGAVYLFRRAEDGTWRQTLYLKSANTDGGDNFGLSLAADAARLLVGAPLEDGSGSGVNPPFDNAAADSGAATLFDFSSP